MITLLVYRSLTWENFRISVRQSVRTIWPFYLAILVALLLITFVPAISLTLPNLLDG